MLKKYTDFLEEDLQASNINVKNISDKELKRTQSQLAKMAMYSIKNSNTVSKDKYNIFDKPKGFSVATDIKAITRLLPDDIIYEKEIGPLYGILITDNITESFKLTKIYTGVMDKEYFIGINGYSIIDNKPYLLKYILDEYTETPEQFINDKLKFLLYNMRENIFLTTKAYLNLNFFGNFVKS